MKPSKKKRTPPARSKKTNRSKIAAGAVSSSKTAQARHKEQRRKIPDKQGISGKSEVGYKKPPRKSQFKPGQSGNPGGRPKSITVADALRRALKQVDPHDPEGRTLAEIVAEQLIHLAMKGRGGHIKIRAIQEIVDRVEGKPRQSVEVLVPKSEIERYEAMIEQYRLDAKEQGIDLSREQAISYLAAADNRILTVLATVSDYTQ